MPTAAREGMTPLQSARFDRILESTKQLIADKGVDGMTMQSIAAASRVAEGTLYNRFGSKDQLIAIAMVDYFERAVGAHVEDPSRRKPVAKIERGVDVLVRAILDAPAFARGLMGAYFRVDGSREMPDRLTERVYATWMSILLDMQARALLHDWVCLPLLCAELCDREFGTVMKWAQRRIDDASFADHLLLAMLSPLLGVSRGAQLTDIAALQARLHKRLGKHVKEPSGTRRRA